MCYDKTGSLPAALKAAQAKYLVTPEMILAARQHMAEREGRP
jgi:hypothetical protein